MTPRRIWGAAARLPAPGALLFLASCAGAQVQHPVTVTDSQPVAPVAVRVTTSQPRTTQNARRLDRTMQALAAGLAKSLEKAHIVAYPADPSEPTPHPNGSDLALVVDIGTLQSGNAWERELVGFGTGKSRLRSHVVLYDERGAQATSLLDFTVKADSGSMPGVIVSAWNPIGFGIHSAHAIAREALSDGHEDADRTAGAIVGKMTEYYRTNRWLPPEEAQGETAGQETAE
ncbi:hypothetical protein AA12717_2616 [Gluconacetobacter sacchari DSM 12717]|uniref:DUF4410 domain-containing protein n=2 Tax=Gluconacetobacter sacchari TaxID=92759 RepID=A0A7W4IC38_9PROT|nr:DUF4410 domain-containing protein [Gluconacetobacter sacchari]MBB2159994.1 DUF4410 domain-containing protein [Gluconacetobacter sacchari]GBQ27250.1 hypothetical protein AA12717_2616 [Gluconacetobacter sacchari DSM 12717]